MAMWWCTLGIVHSPSLKERYRSLCNWIYSPVSVSVDYHELTSFIVFSVAAAPTTPPTSDPQTDPPPPDIDSTIGE